MLKKLCIAISAVFALCAEQNQIPLNFIDNQVIAMQNAILTKVNGSTISVMDVKKKLDFLFHQQYPQLQDSNGARYQFYEASWRRVLMEMVDNELILADAADREIKVTDGEVREEIEARFGPNVLSTLDKIGLTYQEAWKLVKNEMLVRRMSWWFVHSRAIQAVTPQDIKAAYGRYAVEHPPHQEISYQIISIREGDVEDVAARAYSLLQEHSGGLDEEGISQLHALDSSIQVSSVYTASDRDISESYRSILAPLAEKEYSAPVVQKSRANQKVVARIFYLLSREDHPVPSFQELSAQLRDTLTQEALVKESQHYIQKLRKHYGFDAEHLAQNVPDDLHPFSLCPAGGFAR